MKTVVAPVFKRKHCPVSLCIPHTSGSSAGSSFSSTMASSGWSIGPLHAPPEMPVSLKPITPRYTG